MASCSLRLRTNLWSYMQFWLFAWSNSVLKYSNLNDADFDIESVPEGFNFADVLPENYGASADEQIPKEKIQAQQRSTIAQLKRLIAEQPH